MASLPNGNDHSWRGEHAPQEHHAELLEVHQARAIGVKVLEELTQLRLHETKTLDVQFCCQGMAARSN